MATTPKPLKDFPAEILESLAEALKARRDAEVQIPAGAFKDIESAALFVAKAQGKIEAYNEIIALAATVRHNEDKAARKKEQG